MMADPRTRHIPDHLRELQQDIENQCPQVDPKAIAYLFTQLDADYFNVFTATEIAAHVRLLAAVDEEHPVQLHVHAVSDTRAEVQLASYDLFGTFSLITGLMAVFGLNILAGQVFSYETGPGRKTAWGYVEGGLIIDVFTVEWAPVKPFDQLAQDTFAAQLMELIQTLRQGHVQPVREALNYRLIDTIRATNTGFSTGILPVDIHIDNTISPDWTVVHIRAEDTPGFLYSLSNALAMRNLYIHRISIHSEMGKVQDVLYLSWHRGGKILSEAGKRELRLIVALIKQFTHFLTVAPDPAKALRHFDQLMDRLAHTASQADDVQWLWEEEHLKALATVLGSSDFLWEDFLRMHYATLLPVLKNTGETDRRLSKEELMRRLQHDLQKAQTTEVRKLALNAFKDREMFRIDIRHLLHHELPFGAFSSELTELAEVVMSAGLDLAQQGLKDTYVWPDHTDKTPCTVALFGLGKFGGREMGYASDIELLCVYRSDATLDGPTSLAVSEYSEMLVRQLFDLIKARQAGIFEIDLRLRPFGSHGSLATSVESFCQYYRQNGRAALFERQALIKLRWVAGDPDLGQEIERYRDRFVYSGQPFDIDAAVQLRQRQIDELVRFGSTDTKYSRGGLIDVEYLVQYLQLLHGAGRPELHTTNTLEAMEALHQLKLLAPDEFQRLRAVYIFVRHLIDALRIVRGHARDLVLPPTDSDEFVFLARRMDYWDHRRATEKFAADLTAHMRHAAHIYHDRFISSVRRVRSMR